MLAKMSSQDEDDDKQDANTVPEKQPQKSDEKSSIFNTVPKFDVFKSDPESDRTKTFGKTLGKKPDELEKPKPTGSTVLPALKGKSNSLFAKPDNIKKDDSIEEKKTTSQPIGLM